MSKAAKENILEEQKLAKTRNLVSVQRHLGNHLFIVELGFVVMSLGLK